MAKQLQDASTFWGAWELHFPEKINVSDFDDVHHTWKVIPLLQDQTWISFQDFMHKKLLKSVNFWRSYSKNTIWTFFETK